MHGDSGVQDYLNRYLSIELTGHKQYLLHAGLCRKQGFYRLAERQQAYSEEETGHATRLLARLLFLWGIPTMQDVRPLQVEMAVPAQLRLDRALISHAIELLREAVAHCAKVNDPVSRDLFVTMLADEEEHLHWVATQLDLIDAMGLANYLQSQA